LPRLEEQAPAERPEALEAKAEAEAERKEG
jgi:hypothetical protein